MCTTPEAPVPFTRMATERLFWCQTLLWMTTQVSPNFLDPQGML